MITCEFFGGRLAEVMQTIASLFHFAKIKNIPYTEIKLPLSYCGTDFYNVKDYTILDNYPIFHKIGGCFDFKIDYSKYEIWDIAHNWGEYYVRSEYDRSKNICLKNHWFDFIYNTNIYNNLFYSESLWNVIREEYSKILNKRTIAIHVRRKDFILLVENRDKYSEFTNRDILDIKKIKHLIKNITKNINILIFSDDIQWCKKNIKKQDNIYFIEGNKPYKDLIIMSMCDEVVRTPGSTFGKMAMSLRR
jgi:hypothetical protein